jgi:hypothetical protein
MATTTGVASEETSALISANKVEGTTVKNAAGEKLGSIEEIMIDKRSGKVAYAVMSFGGFLGIGDRHHPLPWGVLKYDTSVCWSKHPRMDQRSVLIWPMRPTERRSTTITMCRRIGSNALPVVS